MEEDREMKYDCKLCKKSFSSGRSLGGHMRSHVMNSTEFDHEKSLINGEIDDLIEMGYGLRENPKKSSKFAESSEDTSLHCRVCEACGKSFESWKALFGHMKCHSLIFSQHVEDHEDMNMYSESENEIGIPSRKKRSSRTSKRYMAATTNSSSFSINANNASPTISEIEHEQEEEVAMCLMMLSRDKLLNSVVESSDNNSEFLSAPADLIISEVNTDETEFGKGSKMILDQDQEFHSSKFDKSKINGYHLPDHEEMCAKKSEFECTTCNKTFHSYQALGGHKASHKKLKGCISSKTNDLENNYNNPSRQISSNPVFKVNYHKNNQDSGLSSKKNKSHECSICFRVFSSGQALGGHKRSHLIGIDPKSKQNVSKIKKPVKETRDFLDLNMPAPIEEESSSVITNNSGGFGFKQWWINNNASNNNHDTLLGLFLP